MDSGAERYGGGRTGGRSRGGGVRRFVGGRCRRREEWCGRCVSCSRSRRWSEGCAAAQMPPPRTKSQQLEHERVVSDAMVEYRRLASADDADNNNTSGSNEGSGAPNEMLHTDARGNTAKNCRFHINAVVPKRGKPHNPSPSTHTSVLDTHIRQASRCRNRVDSGSSSSTRETR